MRAAWVMVVIGITGACSSPSTSATPDGGTGTGGTTHLYFLAGGDQLLRIPL